jgi:hypothetical protein
MSQRSGSGAGGEGEVRIAIPLMEMEEMTIKYSSQKQILIDQEKTKRM